MKLTPPKKTTFWISMILAVLGLLGFVTDIPFISDFKFWLLFVGYALLFLGNYLSGL